MLFLADVYVPMDGSVRSALIDIIYAIPITINVLQDLLVFL